MSELRQPKQKFKHSPKTNDKGSKKRHMNEEKKVHYCPSEVKFRKKGQTLVVCFDVETAFGNEISEIYQLGAVVNSEDKFIFTILPQGNIHWGVVKFAGTNVSTEYDPKTGEKFLWHCKQKKELDNVLSPIQGWQEFMTWFCSLKSKYQCDQVILAAHGSLDAPVLLNNLDHFGHLPRFLENIDGFCDTFGFIKNKISAVFDRFYPQDTFEAHNALGDAEALYKILLKKQNPTKTTLIEANEDILRNCLDSQNCWQRSIFNISKKILNLKDSPAPKGIHVINNLALPKLHTLVLKNTPSNTNDKQPKMLEFDQSMTFIAIDLQLLESQCIRSEIVEICAAPIHDETKKFRTVCRGITEDFLDYPTVSEGIKSFVEWLEPYKNVIFVGFKPTVKLWPSLINHVYFHGHSLTFFQNIKGICDLREIILKSQICQGKCDSLDKIHKQLFQQETIELHRSTQVLDSLLRICAKFNAEDFEPIEEMTSSLPMMKKKLDTSLAEDIANGKYYPSGHIGNFRMPEKFHLPESCN